MCSTYVGVTVCIIITARIVLVGGEQPTALQQAQEVSTEKAFRFKNWQIIDHFSPHILEGWARNSEV